MTPEFSRPERVDRIGAGERAVDIAADPQERAALAARFGLLAVDRLAARFTLRAEAGGVAASGRVEAAVTQACVATGDPVPARVDEAVSLRFVAPHDGGAEGEEEVELSADLLDTLPIEGGAIDLGEAAAATMALALDPFPRCPAADAALAAAGVVGEEEAAAATHPFGALAGLRRTLEGE